MGKSDKTDEINKPPEETKKAELAFAAELLYNDYRTDPELTSFSVLDGEGFLSSAN